MTETSKISTLSARKQNELKNAVDACVNAGVQYNLNYVKFEEFAVLIDTDEKRKALIFLLDEVLELTELGFQMAPIVDSLGDPHEIQSINYRQFKLLQELIKNVKLRGREPLLRLSHSMKAFNEDGNRLASIEEESKIMVRAYQEASTAYGNLCKKFGVMPDSNIDNMVEEAFIKAKEELKAKEAEAQTKAAE